MKKIMFILFSCLLYGMTLVTFAQTGNIQDERVDYIYWDQNEIQTYWTGVTNKLDYEWYAPCVGAAHAGIECGDYAKQSQYKEFGLPVYVSHSHALLTKQGYVEYVIQ